MATRKKRLGLALAIIAALLMAGAAYVMATAGGSARTATAYMAHVGCSCRYIAGRDLDSCETDRLAGMELVGLSDDNDTKSVTARFPLLASDTATYREGYGCVLATWSE